MRFHVIELSDGELTAARIACRPREVGEDGLDAYDLGVAYKKLQPDADPATTLVALRMIANGAASPVALAKAALETIGDRVPPDAPEGLGPDPEDVEAVNALALEET